MLNFKCISTGSLGNMYVLENDNKQLIIELGVDYNDILLNLTNINDIVGCITSHFHQDHLKKGNDTKMREFGIPILSHNNTEIGKKYKLENFDIIPLPAIHNVECRSYLIKVDGNTILFATDTSQLPKVNVKIDYFIVEVNYIERLREQAILQDNDSYIHLNGIYNNHHSLESALEYFKSLNYKPKKIITIHSSNSGLFSKEETINALKPYTEEIYVATNKTNYILEEV